MKFYHLGLKILFLFALADGKLDSKEEAYISRYLRIQARKIPGPEVEKIEFRLPARPDVTQILHLMKQFGYLTDDPTRAELVSAAYDIIDADHNITPEEKGLFLALGQILEVDVNGLVDPIV